VRRARELRRLPVGRFVYPMARACERSVSAEKMSNVDTPKLSKRPGFGYDEEKSRFIRVGRKSVTEVAGRGRIMPQ